MAKKVLVIFAHPALEKSRVHRELIRGLSGIEELTFHDLYEAYPNFDVDVAREKDLLTGHDIVVFQHPFFWYSVPALIKEWIDLVLEHGWAYGHKGSALRGKYWLNVITTGGRQEGYVKGGFSKYTVKEFLVPLERTAILCKMKFLAPYVIHGTHMFTPDDIAGHRKALHSFYRSLGAETWDKTELMESDNLINLIQATEKE